MRDIPDHRPGCRLVLAALLALALAGCHDDSSGDSGNPAAADATTCNGLDATIVGTAGDDVIEGTSGADVIVGLGGNDTIHGGDGDDVICGGDGDDVIEGGSGNDLLFGNRGSDQLDGGIGTDVLDGGSNPSGAGDTCDGGIGQDEARNCETTRNVDLVVKKVGLPVWNGSFSPAAGPYAGQSVTHLDGALFVPAGNTRRIALLATHGAFGGYNRSLVGWLGWWFEQYHMTTLVLDRRDSTDYGPNEGGGNTLYPEALCDLKSGVDYLVDTLGYEGVVILGHSKGSEFAPIYPSSFRSCGADVADSPDNNDPRVAAVISVGTVADGREGALVAPLAGPSFEEEAFPGLNCGPTLYGCDLAVAQLEVAAGRGNQVYDFYAGVQLGNGGLLQVSIQITPDSFLSYYGPDTLAVVEREALKLDVPYLIVHADGDSVTPQPWSDRLYDTLTTAGKDVTYYQPPYQGLYPNGSAADPNRGQPAHSLNAEQSRNEVSAYLHDWIVGKIPAASQDATAVNQAEIQALPDFSPALLPTPPDPALP